MRVRLISEKTIKEFSLLDDNTSFDYIAPTLDYVQDMKMVELLGINLYTDIKEAVNNGAVSAEYKTLLDDHIKPILLWNVMSYIQVPLNWKFRNQGMANNNNENSSNMNLGDIQYTKNFFENTAHFYEQQMADYLRKNHSKYPLLKCADNSFNCSITL